jgi:RNA polymerase sigma factor (sigma-70 family)
MKAENLGEPMSQWAEVMDKVVRERRPLLVGYAYLVCGDRSEAEEITQEAIVRTFARGRAKTSIAQAEGYVRRAIVNEAIDRGRRRQVAARHQAAIATPEWAPSHEHGVASQADLEKALATLTPRERAVVVLKYVDDLTVAQIGVALKLNDGTVKRYLHNAAEKLRGHIDDADEVERTQEIRTTVSEGRYA